jgi:hypothetical protein
MLAQAVEVNGQNQVRVTSGIILLPSFMKIGQVVQTLKGHVHSNSKVLTLAVVLPRTAVCWVVMEENSILCSTLKFLHPEDAHSSEMEHIYQSTHHHIQEHCFKLLTQEFKFHKLLPSS